ncbi:MAG: DUF1905 domain-containing protein [Microcella sp.]|uniref:DUF1905 domain-containing protein n=1 Tax=Microcella sp. TaxID=1913979 RepID=UPI00271DBEB1|nr:DUF1905 domain-containing protein [Microcella sp.]MDO8337801.1 DUF1905 domain-containing protein [Microcella sp.]
MPVAFDFDAALFEWSGNTAWHFVAVPEPISDEIAARMEGFTRGFGSVRVQVRIGGSEWATSVFPDSKMGVYLLPVKKPVRQAEGLTAGSTARVHLELVEVIP